MHPLTSRADDRLKSVTLVAVAFSVSLHIEAGMRAAKNEKRHELSLFGLLDLDKERLSPQSSVEPNDNHHGDRRHTKNCYLRCCTRKNVVIV